MDKVKTKKNIFKWNMKLFLLHSEVYTLYVALETKYNPTNVEKDISYSC